MSRFIFNDVKIPILIIKYRKRIFIEIPEDFLWLLGLLSIFLFIHLLFGILQSRSACFLAISSPSLLTEAVYTMKNIATRGHWRYQIAMGSILVPVWILWHNGDPCGIQWHSITRNMIFAYGQVPTASHKCTARDSSLKPMSQSATRAEVGLGSEMGSVSSMRLFPRFCAGLAQSGNFLLH